MANKGGETWKGRALRLLAAATQTRNKNPKNRKHTIGNRFMFNISS
jgi:hypothetical protein